MKNTIIQQVSISDIGSEGKAIAVIDGMIAFVPFVVPGDIIDMKVIRKKRNYIEGVAVHFHQYSANRETAFCSHFGTCGGCKWQHLAYPKQLEFKEKQVKDQLERIGKLELPGVNTIIGSDNTKHYRNKLEYTFSNQRWLEKEEAQVEKTDANLKGLGFHIPGRFDKVLDVVNCYLQPEPSNKIRNFVKAFTLQEEYPYYNMRQHEGFLRNLIIRNNLKGEFMVMVVFAREDKPKMEALLRAMETAFPEITNLLYIINNKKNDTIFDLDVHTWKGNGYFMEELDGLTFKIRPKSFFQTNATQAMKLYQATAAMAGLQGNENVYDLYTGTGTIALYIARNCKHVTGIENVPEAIEDARENARINGITNATFLTGDIKDTFTDALIQEMGKPDVVIIDPPRAGMHPQIIEVLRSHLPGRIVYVSCNPATQARDLGLLSEKYKIMAVQPVDMFPHTQHVENIVLLKGKE